MEAPAEAEAFNGGAESAAANDVSKVTSDAPLGATSSPSGLQEEVEQAQSAGLAAGGGHLAGGEAAFSEHQLMQPAPPQSSATLSVKEYLDAYVVPSLLPALAAVVEEKPPRPVEYLAHFLLDRMASS